MLKAIPNSTPHSKLTHSNITPSQVIEGLETKNRLLAELKERLEECNNDWAEAERVYNVALATEITRLKASGESVTLTERLARGSKSVSDARKEMILAEGRLQAVKEQRWDIRTAIDSYRSYLSFLKLEYENC